MGAVRARWGVMGEMRGRGRLVGALLTAAGASEAQPTELVVNGSFDNSEASAWVSLDELGYSNHALALEVVDGRACTGVPGSDTTLVGIGLGQLGLPIVAGEHYRLSYTVHADADVHPMMVSIEGQAEPYASLLFRNVGLTASPQRFTHSFTAAGSHPSGLFFLIGGAPEPWRFCVDDVSLLSGSPYVPDTGPRVRVNQVGYLPSGPKGATLVTDATDAVRYELVDRRGRWVWHGLSQPRGLDPSSGLNVHEIMGNTSSAAPLPPRSCFPSMSGRCTQQGPIRTRSATVRYACRAR